MIVTTTLNSAVDITYTVEDFSLDRVHRASDVRYTAGGKGINVARLLHTLGQSVTATGFLGGNNGKLITSHLDKEEIQHDFVSVDGESRLCIAILDPTNHTQTEVNENGPSISPTALDSLMAKLRALLADASHIIMSGSAPPSVPSDIYARIIHAAKEMEVVTVLDTSGDFLKEGVAAKPDILKPNVAELSEMIGRELCTVEDVLEAALGLVETGISIVAVSMGRSGAIVTDGINAWKTTPPEIDFVSAVGSGDSMMAAFVDALIKGTDLPEALAVGTAAGTANATDYGAGFCSQQQIMELLPNVTITKIR